MTIRACGHGHGPARYESPASSCSERPSQRNSEYRVIHPFVCSTFFSREDIDRQ